MHLQTSHRAVVVLWLAYLKYTVAEVAWKIYPNDAKSFLTGRYKRDVSSCDSGGEFCPEHRDYCRDQQEYTREVRCSRYSCSPTQTCYINPTTPCQRSCTENQCISNPCHNGGTCIDLTGTYRCDCVPGYDEATDCKTEKNECDALPCQNGAVCTDLFNNFTCLCSKRYNGTTCEQDCRPGHADIIFVVDTSSSIGNHINISIHFISKMMDKLPFGEDDFKFAVIIYDFEPEVLFDFNEYALTSGMVAALNGIKGNVAASYLKPALEKAVELSTNLSSGSRLQNASQYIILVYDGLSTDKHEAEQYATYINNKPRSLRPIKAILTVGIGNYIDHSEMLKITGKPDLTFSPLHFEDTYNKILKLTAHTECTDCVLKTETDIMLLIDTNSNQTVHDYHARQGAARKVIKELLRYNKDIHIRMLSFSDKSRSVLNFSDQADVLVAAALKVDRQIGIMTSNVSYALAQIKKNGFESNGGRLDARKIVIIISNGQWVDLKDVKLQVKQLHVSGVEVLSVVCGQDHVIDSFTNILLDPSQLFYVANNNYRCLGSLAGITSYNVCDHEVFKKRH